jgi:hypothetical protein
LPVIGIFTPAGKKTKQQPIWLSVLQSVHYIAHYSGGILGYLCVNTGHIDLLTSHLVQVADDSESCDMSFRVGDQIIKAHSSLGTIHLKHSN